MHLLRYNVTTLHAWPLGASARLGEFRKKAAPKGRLKVQTGKPSLEVHIRFVSDETHLLDVGTLGNCEHFVDEDIFRFRLRL